MHGTPGTIDVHRHRDFGQSLSLGCLEASSKDRSRDDRLFHLPNGQ